ncbi:MAG TPA: LamG-like jellyroll fold domain-containing protein [Sedimentisphaerales bacterium]|nr:LamG-like jellyroll fold domain-containing protein [Sedimentisphaerales bacterium]
MMQSRLNVLCKLMMVSMLFLLTASLVHGQENYFPSFSDEHTVGLWLFDETDYPYTTLTDASQYEYDLRLMKGGKLVPGKFGNCLKCTPGLDYAVGYSSWKGHIAFAHMREVSGRPGSGLWGPTVAPEKLLNALDGRDFTCEFWLLLMSSPIQDVVLIDLGDKYEPGFTLTLKTGAKGFVIENTYAGFRAECPTVLQQIWGRTWHHVAFTYSPASRKLEYFIDGVSQGSAPTSPVAKSNVPASIWPESLNNTTYGIFEKERRTDKPDFEKRRQNRFNMALGHDRHGEHDFNGNIDEVRFSDVIRYTGNFALPDSFSRNYRKGAAAPAVADGPPLLFGADKVYLPNEPIRLGSRRHVFIDEVIVERKRNIELTVNPPAEPVITNARTSGDTPIFDHDGKVWMVRTPGYGSHVGNIRLLISEDGINFTEPDLGITEYEGSKRNNVILTHVPCWGRFFKDTNPNVHPEERFKFTGWIAQRGIYLYLSPDGIHWRRNETCMLPLVSGGGCETFWDDQRGVYVNLLKRDGSYNTGDFPAYGRGATLFETREVTKAWPMRDVPNPYFEGWAYPAVTGEGITVMGPDLFDPDRGQVFRTRARKYEWAPDTYVAFLARNAHTELAVSRDSINWHIFDAEGDSPYLPKTLQMDGEKVGLGWVTDGLIRRGDTIWQYSNPEGRPRGKTVRFIQRLDGFVSLDAGEQTGTIITRPLIFEGSKLTLNVAAKGMVKVALLNLPGMEISGYNVGLTDAPKKPVRGFGIDDCDPIRTNSVRQVVAWKGDSDVGNLAGQMVRLRFEMQNAKLFAFQFE